MRQLRLASYLLRETAWLYVLGVMAFSLLISIDFLVSWASFLIDYNAPPASVGRLVLYKIPWFLHLSLPIAIVFAILLATGRLAKDSELKAAYALGVPPLKLLGPLLGFGLLVSLLTLLNNGFIEPKSEVAHLHELNTFIIQRPPTEMQSDVSYLVPDEGIYYAGQIRVDTDDKRVAHLRGVTVIRPDRSILSAREGIWDSRERTWTLQNAEVTEPGRPPYAAGRVTLSFSEGDAEATLARAESLTLGELWDRIQQLRAVGADVGSELFELHRRIADAFNGVIFVLIAGTLGLHLRNRSAGFAWTIVLLVLFYFVWSLSPALYDQRVLPPVAAAWFTSMVAGLLGGTLAVMRLR